MTKIKKILVVDDEISMRKNIKDFLTFKGFFVIEAMDGPEAIVKVIESEPKLVLLDINLPKMNGLAVLSEIKKINEDIPVIIFTAFGTSESIIDAMKSGAFDYIEKPFELDEFLLVVQRAIKYESLLDEVKILRSQVEGIQSITFEEEFIGKSSKMLEIFKLIGRVAPTDATVLIQGESGTGKELIANAIQRHSTRKDKPFIKVNCGAFPESLLESEIFGHEKGSFTGATALRLGRFELANTGTIYLDEINNMPVSLQIRLLRVLQYKTFERIGGKDTLKTDVRIIASSNKDIEKEVKEGKFREDLFYRLNVVRINVPPLRDRIDDIPHLIEYFVRKYSPNKKIVIPPNIIKELQSYEWQGNARELENVIHSLIVMTQGNVITNGNLPSKIKTGDSIISYFHKINEGKSFSEIITEVEKDLITNALIQTNWNQTQAAKLLQINRRLLYTKIKDYNIESIE